LSTRDAYLLRCYRYIELNPVRAAMVESPGHYRWSSYAANASGQGDALVTPHPEYVALGIGDVARRSAYAALVAEAISEDVLAGNPHVSPAGASLGQRPLPRRRRCQNAPVQRRTPASPATQALR
jgi:hypothetical protein